MISLEGKTVLVTGGAQGIGFGCAKVLAHAGADVVINDVDAERGRAAAEAVRAHGRRCLFMEADVSDAAAVEGMSRRLAAEIPSLEGLINNAGINLFRGLEATSLEDWDRVLNVDLKGIYTVTRALLPLLERGAPASVVNIASVHASQTIAEITAYAAAKGGVVALTRSLCQELGPKGIRVNSISPGFVETPLLRRWRESTPDPEATAERVAALHPVGRIGAPEDVGYMAAFLLSGLAGFITGANLVVDGGLTSRLMH